MSKRTIDGARKSEIREDIDISQNNELEGDERDHQDSLEMETSLNKTNRNNSRIRQDNGNINNQMNDVTVKRNIKDMIGTDINKRNILHRASLEQNKKLMEDVIRDYSELISKKEQQRKLTLLNNEKKAKKLSLKESLNTYINLTDKFGNSPMLNACSQNFENSNKIRVDCLRLLLEHGANPNIRNKMTGWSCIYWLCHYGDELSINLALNFKEQIPNSVWSEIELQIPDYLGFYPLDLAGKRNNKGIVQLLLTKMLEQIESHDRSTNSTDYDERDSFYTQRKEKLDKYWNSPMIRTSMLYWAVYFQQDMKLINKICNFENLFIEAPMFLVHKMTVFHACAKTGNEECLVSLLGKVKDKHAETMRAIKNTPNNFAKFEFSLFKNKVLSLTKVEKEFFNARYLEKIEKFARWIFTYEKLIYEGQKKNPPRTVFIFFDVPELYGNTPLHLATMLGFEKCVRHLIQYGANIDFENKEGFKPRDLIQIPSIKNIYTKEVDELRKAGKISSSGSTEREKKIHYLSRIIGGQKNEIKRLERKYSENFGAMEASVPLNYDGYIEKIVMEILDRDVNQFVPDFVIKFNKKPNFLFKIELNQIFSENEMKDDEADRINFYISLLIAARFEVKLASSVYDNKFYVLLTLPEEELYNLCQNSKVKCKLIDSYNYKVFEKKDISRFEPFRSGQRQEIIFNYLQKILDLEILKNEGLVESYFPMHSTSGIFKIRRKWINQPKWYWPQPLNQIFDYIKEGKDQNFSSITYLRHYLGEKITYFFAFKSFNTCFLLPVAIPGCVLQIYIFYFDQFNSNFIPFWVLYMCLWSTILVEFWKRKNSEINTRWGTLMVLDNENLEKKVRKEFSGDEWVSSFTGEVTKFHKAAKTHLIFMASLPILILLFVLCVGSFLLIENFKDKYGSEKNYFIMTLAGFMNGASITSLNLVYTGLARWFVNKENHKYYIAYERSLIMKSISFRLFNSFFGIFYLSFFKQGSTFEDIFFMLLPVLLTKQANNIFTSIILPWVFYKLKQDDYFKKLKKKAFQQIERGRILEDDILKDPYLRIINHQKKYESYYNRAILSLQSEKEGIELLKNCDLDAVELNSLRVDFLDTINYYAESFIEFGYISMFAAAFPIGPMIAIFSDIFELRWKIYSFIYVLKRPLSEKCSGLGPWLNVWELLSLLSVFTNFFLLYFKKQQEFYVPSAFLGSFYLETIKNRYFINSTFSNLINELSRSNQTELYNYLTSVNATSEYLNVTNASDINYISYSLDTGRLWSVLIIIASVVFLKYFFGVVINDKPKWVREEEEKHKVSLEKKLNQEQKRPLIVEKSPNNEEHKHSSKKISEKEHLLWKKEKELRVLAEKLKKEKEKLGLIQSDLSPIKMDSTRPLSLAEFKQNFLGILRKTYLELEREILLLRLEDILNMDTESIHLCGECHKKKAVFECATCGGAFFCRHCFQKLHELLVAESHIVEVLNPKIEDFSKFLDQNKFKYNVLNRNSTTGNNNLTDNANNPSERSTLNERQSILKIFNFKKKDTGKRKEILTTETIDTVKDANEWKKFENFSLPVYERSSYFYSLKAAYETLRKVYLDQNGFRKGKFNFDMSAFMKYEYFEENEPAGGNSSKSKNDDNAKSPSFLNLSKDLGIKNIRGKFLLIKDSNMGKFIEMEDFSNEDKLFLNRLAFYCFKKLGLDCSFSEFHRQCKVLQEGIFEQKVLLLLEMMDENDGNVSREDLRMLFTTSFMKMTPLQQDTKTTIVEDVISLIFKEKEELPKKEILTLVLGDYQLRKFFGAYLQSEV